MKAIQAGKIMKKIMADHFLDLDRAAKEGKPKVAWCTSVGPAELLRAMGFNVYFPENHGAMLGATAMATDLIPVANAQGLLPGHLLLPDQRRRSVPEGRTPLQKMSWPARPRPTCWSSTPTSAAT